MASVQTVPAPRLPILIEIDRESWEDQLDSVAHWLGNTQMAEAAFRQLTEDVVKKVTEPHVRFYLSDIAKRSLRHEEILETIFHQIGREPSKFRKVAGNLVAKGREVLADVLGLTSGASAGAWGDLHQLLMASMNSVGAVGVAQQLGLAIGHQGLTEATLKLSNEKHVQHFLLQELVLEMAPISILYKAKI